MKKALIVIDIQNDYTIRGTHDNIWEFQYKINHSFCNVSLLPFWTDGTTLLVATPLFQSHQFHYRLKNQNIFLSLTVTACHGFAV